MPTNLVLSPEVVFDREAEVTRRVEGDPVLQEPGADVAADDYRTLPARLPTMLAAIGGFLAVIGGLGAGLRASEMISARELPREVAVLMGYRHAGGWAVAVLGLAGAIAGIAWLGRRGVPKLFAAACAAALTALAIRRLAALDDTATRWAELARRAGKVGAYHAGLGWGAWLLLAGAILTGLSLVSGGLRQADLRRGISG